MAILREQETQTPLYLRSTHIFGRNSAKADTVLRNGDASQIHASIRWEGKAWVLVDHSRNGCIVDGERLAANPKLTLALGMKIRFAAGSNIEWKVENLDPPCPMLLPLREGSPAIMLQSLHALPSVEAPESTVYLSPDGQWIWEHSMGSVALQDGSCVQVGNDSWTFVGSPEIEITSDILSFAVPGQHTALFNFVVSQNEEHISISVVDRGRSADLGERTHHYGLLTLARRRHEDAARGIEASSQGWIEVEQLSKMLGLDTAHLNIQIFRARSQIARALPGGSNLNNVIERRRGEVRFGSFQLRIIRGSSIEATFNPSFSLASGAVKTSHAAQAVQRVF